MVSVQGGSPVRGFLGYRDNTRIDAAQAQQLSDCIRLTTTYGTLLGFSISQRLLFLAQPVSTGGCACLCTCARSVMHGSGSTCVACGQDVLNGVVAGLVVQRWSFRSCRG